MLQGRLSPASQAVITVDQLRTQDCSDFYMYTV